MPTGARGFLLAFALGIIVLVGPLMGLAVRLVHLGEIALPIGAGPTVALSGTLFTDDPIRNLREVLRRQPDVVVLGSSRVGALRAEMFAGCHDRPGCFYNATGAMATIRTGLEFFRSLSSVRAPDLLVVGIDVWDFDPNHRPAVREFADPLQRDLRGHLDHALAITRRVAALSLTDAGIRDVVLGRRTVPADAAGLAAIIHRTGYRPDGSFESPVSVWRRAITFSDEDRSAEHLHSLRIGGYDFEPFERADDQALRDLGDLLDLAAARGTKIAAFTPPFGDALAAAMRAQPHYAEGLADIYARLAQTFADRGIPFLAGLSMSDYGCGSDEHIDGMHMSEVCAARVLMSVAGSPGGARALGGYVDARDLSRRLATRQSSFLLSGAP